MIRDIPYQIYERYLGHELSQEERTELVQRRLVCLENRVKAGRGCCFAAAQTFKEEADYISSILGE